MTTCEECLDQLHEGAGCAERIWMAIEQGKLEEAKELAHEIHDYNNIIVAKSGWMPDECL